MLVDSYFDVFFEVTVNNDNPIPERGGTGARYTLADVPEPASVGLLMAGLFGLSAYRRQLRRQERERP